MMLRKLLLAGLGVVFSVCVPFSAAFASTTAPTTSSFICNTGQASLSRATVGGQPDLPIERWASVAGGDMHTRFSSFPLSDLSDRVNRNIVDSTSMGFGNALWKASTSLVEEASQFCVGDSIAYQADHLSSGIGHALSSSGVLLALALVAVLVFLWKASRTAERPWRHLIVTLAVVAVFIVMLNGASQTRRTAGGGVTFGTMSPGWITTKVDDVVSTLGSLPTSAFSSASSNLSGYTGTQRGALSCGHYVRSLLSSYQRSYGPTPADQLPASTPMALDAMWEQTGLRSYINVQFGTGNGYGPQVYCHLLEDNLGVSGASQLSVYEHPPQNVRVDKDTPLPASLAKTANPSSLAMIGSTADNTGVDMSMVGWAACQTDAAGNSWTIPQDFTVTDNPNSHTSRTVTPQVCQNWWHEVYTGTGGGLVKTGFFSGPLNWSSGASSIENATGAANAGPLANYLLNLHGFSNGTATATAIMFLVTSMVVFVVFAILALAIIISKFALLVAMALLLLVLVVAMFPSSGGTHKVTSVAKWMIGLMVFSTGAQLILSLVAVITGFIVNVGSSTFGAGSMEEVLWTGIAPVSAILVIHMLFTKVLKVASPFKLSGALGWAGAIGGIGGGVAAAGAKVDSRLSHHGQRAGRAAWSRTGGRYGAARDLGSERNKRTGGMEDTVDGPTTARGHGAGTGPGRRAGGMRPDTAAGAAGAASAGAASAGAAIGGAFTSKGRVAGSAGAAGAAGAAGVAAGMVAGNGRAGLSPRGPSGASGKLLNDLRAKRDRRQVINSGFVGGVRGRMTEAGKDRAKLAWERFRAKPVRNSLKVAGAVTAAGLSPFGFLPTLGVAAAAYGIHKAKQAHRERPAMRTLRAQAHQDAYLAHAGRKSEAASQMGAMYQDINKNPEMSEQFHQKIGVPAGEAWEKRLIDKHGPDRAHRMVSDFHSNHIETDGQAASRNGQPQAQPAPRQPQAQGQPAGQPAWTNPPARPNTDYLQ